MDIAGGTPPTVQAASAPAASPGAKRRVGGGFLAGAGGRLLPASVPMRWFGAAIAFHVVAWLALAAGAPQWPNWRGGLGWPLAALHLMTVGTLLASAIGASVQLLPVATRQPVRWPRLVALLWWLFVPGVSVLALGMGLARPSWMAVGATLVLGVLAAWAVLLAANLRGAHGMPGVVLHGWGTLAALVLLGASAAALVALWNGMAAPAPSRDVLRAAHAAAGVPGVMGLLLLGLSTVLLPMFALAPVPPERSQQRSGGAAIVAVLLFALAGFAGPESAVASTTRWVALAAATLALGGHVRMMRRVLAGGMRHDLGRSARLVRIGWCAAAAALACVALGGFGWGARSDVPWGMLAAIAAIGGWLASALFGVLQRILPFLASMHAARGARRRPPTPSALAFEAALPVHEIAHLAAWSLLALAVVTRSPAWLLAAAACGAVGAAAFATFFAVLMLRLHRSLHARATPT